MAIEFQELVHWQEGLFLQPHHLQLMQNTLVDRGRAERRLSQPHPYGLISIEIDESALGNNILKLERVAAVMPSGVEVSAPGNAMVPPLNLREHVEEHREPFTVFLGVPLWSQREPNVLPPGKQAAAGNRNLYNLVEREIPDENTGENPQSVYTRRVNASLITELDNMTNLETIPLVRLQCVSKETAETSLEIAKDFIPPCLCVGGSERLLKMIRNLIEEVSGFREDLVNALNKTGYTAETLSGLQLEKILLLRSINVHAAKLRSMGERPSLHPYVFYLELRALLGELAALQPVRDLYDAPDYEHENCRPVFLEVISRIRNLSNLEGTGSYIRVAFAKAEDFRGQMAELTDEHLVRAEDYFLAVQTREPFNKVIPIVETGDQFKLIAKSQAGARIRGVKLHEERYPPPVLPPLQNVVWFRLKRSESPRAWNRIREEKNIVAQWSEELLPQISVALYITVFESKVEDL